MAIDGVSLSTLLASRQQSTTSSTRSVSSTSSTSTIGSDPAYLLSLGQQQSKAALLGYSDLGKLVKQADASLAAMDRDNPAAIVTLGNGTLLQESHSIDVQQLARAQILVSGAYASADLDVAGSGPLTIQTGGYDPSTGAFAPVGDGVTVQISDGSLNGIAAAINAADAGLTASVISGADGTYKLQLSGQTGAASAFELSGIDILAYDPAAPSATGLQAIQSAADALYTVDGGPAQTSATNDDVAIGSGLVATLTATGPMTVNVPFGFTRAAGAAQALADAINTFLNGVVGLTGDGNPLAGSSGPASQLRDALDELLTQGISGKGELSGLADIGMTVETDGTLTIDPGKFQKAYAADPAGTRQALDTAANAIRRILSGTGGASDQIHDQLKELVTAMIGQMPSLTDILSQADADSSGQQTDSLFGSFSQTGSLLSTLQSNPDLAAALSRTWGDSSLPSALGIDNASKTTDSGIDSLLAEIAAAMGGSQEAQS